jgi:hypothetical protein
LPSVEIFPLPKQTNATSPLFVVVATDGIWDCWRYELFADHVLTATRDIAAGQSLQAVTTSSVELTIKKAIERYSSSLILSHLSITCLIRSVFPCFQLWCPAL